MFTWFGTISLNISRSRQDYIFFVKNLDLFKKGAQINGTENTLPRN